MMQVMSQGGEYQREWGLANGGEFFAQRGENLCIGGRERGRGVGGWVGGDNQSLLSHHPDQTSQMTQTSVQVFSHAYLCCQFQPV